MIPLMVCSSGPNRIEQMRRWFQMVMTVLDSLAMGKVAVRIESEGAK